MAIHLKSDVITWSELVGTLSSVVPQKTRQLGGTDLNEKCFSLRNMVANMYTR